MITRGQLHPIGTFLKPHGIKGEIAAEIDEGIEPVDLRCIVTDIDGIYVPFFVGSSRRKSADTLLLTIDGYDDERAVAFLGNHHIYAMADDPVIQGHDEDDDPDRFYISDLIGYTLADTDGNVIGRIDDYDDSTANVLLIVDRGDSQAVYVPLADEYITGIDPEKAVISMDLPEGLFET